MYIEQFNLFDKIKEQLSDFPCDNCKYDVLGCCNYNDTTDDYCVMGDKQVPRV